MLLRPETDPEAAGACWPPAGKRRAASRRPTAGADHLGRSIGQRQSRPHPCKLRIVEATWRLGRSNPLGGFRPDRKEPAPPDRNLPSGRMPSSMNRHRYGSNGLKPDARLCPLADPPLCTRRLSGDHHALRCASASLAPCRSAPLVGEPGTPPASSSAVAPAPNAYVPGSPASLPSLSLRRTTSPNVQVSFPDLRNGAEDPWPHPRVLLLAAPHGAPLRHQPTDHTRLQQMKVTQFPSPCPVNARQPPRPCHGHKPFVLPLNSTAAPVRHCRTTAPG